MPLKCTKSNIELVEKCEIVVNGHTGQGFIMCSNKFITPYEISIAVTIRSFIPLSGGEDDFSNRYLARSALSLVHRVCSWYAVVREALNVILVLTIDFPLNLFTIFTRLLFNPFPFNACDS